MYRLGGMVSANFYTFIDERLLARDVDYPLVYELVYGENAYNKDAKDKKAIIHLDMVLADGQPMLSYTTPERIASYMERTGSPVDNYYAREPFRVRARPGKVMKSITKSEDNKAIEQFVKTFNAFVYAVHGNESAVQVVRGQDIPYWYNEDHYCDCKSTYSLAQSCMRYDHLSKNGTFAIYVDNCEMAVLFCPDCGKLRARAILWDDRAGGRYIDRIYGTEQEQSAIRLWASNRDYTSVYGSRDMEHVRIPLVRKYPRRPWLDSMGHLCDRCNCAGTDDHYRCEPNKHAIPSVQGEQEWNWDESGYYDAPHVSHRNACPHCGSDMDGESDECDAASYCRGCGDRWCPNDPAHTCRQCEECDAWYDEDESCPNEEYCDVHDVYFHDECPNEEYCGMCGASSCDSGTKCLCGVC